MKVKEGLKVRMAISGFFICLLLAHGILKPDPVGMLLYMILPFPLNIIIFLKAFRDYIDSRQKVNPHGDVESEIQTKP